MGEELTSNQGSRAHNLTRTDEARRVCWPLTVTSTVMPKTPDVLCTPGLS